MTTTVSNFLTQEEEETIIEAIRTAEKTTSGEIRVHIEHSVPGTAVERAADLFHLLKMDTTRLRNGVLIYVAVNDKVFAIYGDEGIDEAVPDNFWDTVRDTMENHFKKGEFSEGLVAGILKTGTQLQQHFPWYAGDKNELDDAISTA